MWSFFSRDPARDFPYEISDVIPGLEEKSIWQMHKGKKKASGEPVTVFVFEVKPGGEDLLETAKSAVKRLKTLRHPNILTYIDSLETDKIVYLVTEPVETLECHLADEDVYTESQKKLAISWGLHQVVKGLSFLINDCSLAHNNVCLSSVFVDQAGNWRLAGIEYMSPASDPSPFKSVRYWERYNTPERGDPARKKVSKWSTDSWGLGCLIWEAFNGPLPKPTSLKSLGKIPKNLSAHYCELVGANPSSRPNPADFINKCRASGGFFKNSFVDTMIFIEEMQIKDSHEKSRFFANLTPLLDSFPQNICKYNILPQLVNAFEFGDAGSAVLSPMFKLGKLLDTEQYQKKIVPCVVKLFSSKDRATRAKLLQQMDQFVHHLQPCLINDQIFPQIIQGFMDTNPTIREQTVKCMLHLSSKLNYHNLDEELLKHFARLQAKDDQGGIRTNTTVCLGKIASYLHPQTRQKVLIPAFSRAMRDPFPPARTAGILALSATQSYYTLRDCATRILPALCALTVDPDKSVRDQAFKAAKGFLSKLEKVSEDPSLAEQMEADVNAVGSGSSTSTAASWAGWAVSSLTAKFYKSSQQSPSKPATTQASSQLPKPSSDSSHSVVSDHSHAAAATIKDDHQDSGSDYEEEWNDWGDIEDSSVTSLTTAVPTPSSKLEGWDVNEDWESFEIDPERAESNKIVSSSRGDWSEGLHEDFIPADPKLKPASSYNWKTQPSSVSDDVFSSLGVSSKMETKKSSEHQSSRIENQMVTKSVDDKWGDWNDQFQDKTQNKTEEVRKKREERRQQKLKEFQARKAARQGTSGPMKLGVRKEH
ncbi:LOW QUALITY PROTEIN: N-terminal kinase-like protein [Tachypleus tridentatus]|uniref:LOW QUALITY PROTEIN: N-terminal kinase-like protein n=1 Tax=Tachypleus tridentatus TaxID=6853 RepID=UPI003FD3C5E2